MLEKKGYRFVEATKKKVFISYSHKDKEIVVPIVMELNSCGINVFIDFLCIDYGENILAKYSQGMKESDLCVLFLSKAYSTSFHAKHELTMAFNDVITQGKKMIPIKLDNIELDEIIYGLNGYKYYTYNNDIKEVVNIISTTIE